MKLKNLVFMNIGKCNRCEIKNDLELHHWTYENFGHETSEEVELLCRKCHQSITEMSSEITLNMFLPITLNSWVIDAIDENEILIEHKFYIPSNEELYFFLLDEESYFKDKARSLLVTQKYLDQLLLHYDKSKSKIILYDHYQKCELYRVKDFENSELDRIHRKHGLDLIVLN